jgi:hypothetical protein
VKFTYQKPTNSSTLVRLLWNFSNSFRNPFRPRKSSQFCSNSIDSLSKPLQISVYMLQLTISKSFFNLKLCLLLHLHSLSSPQRLHRESWKADNIANLSETWGWLHSKGDRDAQKRGTAVNLSWNIIVSQAYISSHPAFAFSSMSSVCVCAHIIFHLDTVGFAKQISCAFFSHAIGDRMRNWGAFSGVWKIDAVWWEGEGELKGWERQKTSC